MVSLLLQRFCTLIVKSIHYNTALFLLLYSMTASICFLSLVLSSMTSVPAFIVQEGTSCTRTNGSTLLVLIYSKGRLITVQCIMLLGKRENLLEERSGRGRTMPAIVMEGHGHGLSFLQAIGRNACIWCVVQVSC